MPVATARHAILPLRESQSRAGVSPDQRARQREQDERSSVGLVAEGRRDACPTLGLIQLTVPMRAQNSAEQVRALGARSATGSQGSNDSSLISSSDFFLPSIFISSSSISGVRQPAPLSLDRIPLDDASVRCWPPGFLPRPRADARPVG